jgi:hypothetical protein
VTGQGHDQHGRCLDCGAQWASCLCGCGCRTAADLLVIEAREQTRLARFALALVVVGWLITGFGLLMVCGVRHG